MTGWTAAHRPFRKHVLALVAAAGVVAWGGGAAGLRVPSAGATPVPGRAGIAAFSHVESAALTSGGALAAGLVASGERPQTRPPGDGGADAGGARSKAPALRGVSWRASERVAALLMAPTPGLEAASPLGPPSFPS